MTLPLPPEPHEGLKADADPETRAAESGQSPSIARGGQSSGTADTGPAPGDEQPEEALTSGTAGGDPLSGVGASEQDSREAVSGDTGPEHPGRR